MSKHGSAGATAAFSVLMLIAQAAFPSVARANSGYFGPGLFFFTMGWTEWLAVVLYASAALSLSGVSVFMLRRLAARVSDQPVDGTDHG